MDKGDGDEDQQDGDVGQEASGDGGREIVCYDGVDSSKTIDEAIAGVVMQTPANHLADIYADRRDWVSDDSDAEDRGAGINLDKYALHPFATCDATQKWMEWNSK